MTAQTHFPCLDSTVVAQHQMSRGASHAITMADPDDVHLVHPFFDRALSTAARAIGTIADSGKGDTLLALISHST